MDSIRDAMGAYSGDPEQNLLFFRVIVFFYASLNLYLDLQPRHYGWQNGMFFAKYTHWMEAAIVLYFGLAISTQFAPDLQNLQNLRVISFAALLPMTLYLDIGFFVAVYPVRILTGKEGGPFLSPTSWHKHLLNLGWVIGDALMMECAARHTPGRGSFHTNGDVPSVTLPWVSVNVIPYVFNVAYLVLAWLIRYKPTGLFIFRMIGNPTIPGVFRVAPGLWIYGAFGLWPIQVLHVISPRYICTPLAHMMLAWCASASPEVVQRFLFVMVGATPFVYGVYAPILKKFSDKKRD